VSIIAQVYLKISVHLPAITIPPRPIQAESKLVGNSSSSLVEHWGVSGGSVHRAPGIVVIRA